ncbi:MAG: XdhC family protein [candidate division Zixibacteria bacterium]|nr:XdhC family protein [Candidatus Tariuqbacter arcticus]
MRDIYIELAEIRRGNIPAALVTVVGVKGSVPRHLGAKMIVKADGSIIGSVGGAEVELKAVQEALSAIKDGESRKITYVLNEEDVSNSDDKEKTKMICGGEMELFIEPLTVSPTLYLFGAGHVGKPTAHLAAMCGFRVRVFDNRSDMAAKERFPEAEEINVGNMTEAAGELEAAADSFAVIVTSSHESDYRVLENLIAKPFTYIGVICSRRKWKLFRRRLMEAGFEEEVIDRVHAPIGLDIGSETPEEIAVSIAAELIKVKH